MKLVILEIYFYFCIFIIIFSFVIIILYYIKLYALNNIIVVFYLSIII